MRKALIAVLLLLLIPSAFAETGGTQITPDTEKQLTEKEAARPIAGVLSFSSFAGGGYEYTVRLDDPTIVSCESRYEYEPHAEEIDGASFDFIVSVTGLKPGKTTVTVYGRSPIAENEDRVYTASVDEDLNVTLTPVRRIATFYVYRSGEIRYDSYHITMNENGYALSVSEEPEQPLSADVADALMEVIDTFDMSSWDGFSESRSHVLDGEGFWLEYTLTDGTSVLARGDNAFPDHYFDAMGAIWNILTGIREEKSEMKLLIGDTEVPVAWEDNESVKELKSLLPLTVQLSKYGGFEQVGPIGRSIARNDQQTVTDSGDIVLYSGNQIVIFYGSNSWAYTRLGHINLSQKQMTDLLSHEDVKITITED